MKLRNNRLLVAGLAAMTAFSLAACAAPSRSDEKAMQKLEQALENLDPAIESVEVRGVATGEGFTWQPEVRIELVDPSDATADLLYRVLGEIDTLPKEITGRWLYLAFLNANEVDFCVPEEVVEEAERKLGETIEGTRSNFSIVTVQPGVFQELMEENCPEKLTSLH